MFKMNKENLQFNKKYILYFFKFLNKKQINYFLLGYNNQFPNKIFSDIDLYIDFKDFTDLKKIVLGFCNNYGLRINNVIRHEFNSFYFILNKKIKKKNFYIKLDICNSYVANSRKLIDFKSAKKIKKNYKSFYYFVLDDYYNIYYYFLKKIIKNDFNEKQFFILKETYSKLKSQYFINFFGFKAYKIFSDCFTNANYKIFLKKKDNVYKKIIKLNYFNYIHFFKKLFFRYKYKTGLHVAILGIDGSGKTTQINLIQNSNLKYSFRNVFTQHLFGKKRLNKKINKPYMLKNYGYFLSFIKITYLYLSFLYNFLTKLYFKKICSTLIINDRYFEDIIVDPQRYRIGKFNFVLKYLYIFLPKPDVTFFLKTKSKILSKRKNEVKNTRLNSLTKNYSDFCKKNKYIKVINADQKIEKINILLENLINDYLIKRLKKIH